MSQEGNPDCGLLFSVAAKNDDHFQVLFDRQDQLISLFSKAYAGVRKHFFPAFFFFDEGIAAIA